MAPSFLCAFFTLSEKVQVRLVKQVGEKTQNYLKVSTQLLNSLSLDALSKRVHNLVITDYSSHLTILNSSRALFLLLLLSENTEV